MQAAAASTRARVAVVASHPIMRAALRTLLESAARFETVGDGESAPDVLGRVAADVVLIDVPPDVDPAPLVAAAASAGGVAVVVLLDDNDLAQCSAAIGAGAAGVVGRQHPPQTLFAAIDRVHAGGTSIDRSILAGIVRMSKSADAPTDRYHTLSKREREVAALVTEGLKNKEIAQRLFISDTTVRHHLTSIFGKLGVNGRLELLASQRLLPPPRRSFRA